MLVQLALFDIGDFFLKCVLPCALVFRIIEV